MVGVLKSRVPLWAVVLGGLVLLVGGFWFGRSGPGAAHSAQAFSGTVSAVGQSGDEFAMTLDGTGTTASYGLGPVPWAYSTETDSVHEGGTPACIAVGRHVTVGVVPVTFGAMSSGQVVWVECFLSDASLACGPRSCTIRVCTANFAVQT
jgi:hypothetical protein